MIRYAFFFCITSLPGFAQAQNSSAEAIPVQPGRLQSVSKIDFFPSAALLVPRWELKFESRDYPSWNYEFWPNRSGGLVVRSRYYRLGRGNGFGPRMANVFAEILRFGVASEDIPPLAITFSFQCF